MIAALVAVFLVGSALPAGAVVATKPQPTWGTNGRVTAILPLGNRVVVGGTFTAVIDRSGVTHPASNLAVFEVSTGAADLSWNGTTNGPVYALAALDGKLFVGGNFSSVNGQSRADLAALDPATGDLLSWKAGSNATVDSLVTADGSLYASGNFTRVITPAGSVARPYVAKLSTTTGALDTTWAPAANARVRALAASPDGSTIFLGGDFTTVGAANTNKVAAVSASTGTPLAGFRARPNNGSSFAVVFALSTDGSRLYEAVGGSGGACTAVDAGTGATVWSKRANGNLHAVQRLGSEVYCGGHFAGAGSFDGQTRHKLAAVNAATGQTLAFAPRVNSALGVWALAADAPRLYAGGDFTKISRVVAQHYATFVDSTL